MVEKIKRIEELIEELRNEHPESGVLFVAAEKGVGSIVKLAGEESRISVALQDAMFQKINLEALVVKAAEGFNHRLETYGGKEVRERYQKYIHVLIAE